jgi:hypothetical protein
MLGHMTNMEKNIQPATFRLPKSGERDPYFGLSRSFYYAAEAEGQLKLVRLKKRGNHRGVTLVPYAAILELLNTEMHHPEGHA